MEGINYEVPGRQEALHAIVPVEPTPDERAIMLGIAAAEVEEREIDDATARRIAAQLDGGEESALYTLASSGQIDEKRVVREIGRELEQQRDPEVREWLNWLGSYCIKREHKGPVDGWHELTADESTIEPGPGGHELGELAISDTADTPDEDDHGGEDAWPSLSELNAAGVVPLGQIAAEGSGVEVDEHTRFPFLQWRFLVGAQEPVGSLSHAYRLPRDNETLCGAARSIQGAAQFPRIQITDEAITVLDTRCPDCIGEANRRWGPAGESQDAGDHGEDDILHDENAEEMPIEHPRIWVGSLRPPEASECFVAWQRFQFGHISANLVEYTLDCGCVCSGGSGWYAGFSGASA